MFLMINTLISALLCCVLSNEVLAQQLLTKDNEKINFAQNLLVKSQYRLAASQYVEFIQEYPQSTLLQSAYIGAGDSHFFLKEYDQAISFYQKYSELFLEGKDRWLALLRWGQSLYLLGERTKALSKLIAIDVATVQPQFLQTFHFFLAQCYASQNYIKEAEINFTKAIQAQASGGYTSEIYFLWGSMLTDEVNYVNAMDKYTKAFDVADNDQMKAEILMKEAQIQFLFGQYDVAGKIFKSIIDGYSSTSVIQDATVNWFVCLSRNNQFNMLIAYYNQQFKDNFQDPKWVGVHLSVVEALIKQDKSNDALAILNNLLTMPSIEEKSKNKAIVQKAQILININKWADAISFIDGQTVANKADKIFLMLLKGQTQVDLKDYDKAWEVYLNLSQEFPDVPEAFCGMAHIRFSQGNFDQAASLFMDCYSKGKQEASRQSALYNSFLMYQKSAIQDKAMETAELYLQEYPQSKQSSEVILDMAGLYSKGQKYDQAVAVLKKLTDSSDEQYRQQALFQTAFNYQLSGANDQALKIYEQLSANVLDPEFKFFVFKNMVIIYLQENSQDKAAEMLDWIVHSFPPNDLPIKNYLWLVEYWQIKNEPQKMLNVLMEAQKRPADPLESLGIVFFTAEANRLNNNCSVSAYDEVIKVVPNNIYMGRARVAKGMCLVSGGDPANAQKEFEQAIIDNPEDNFVTMHARFELALLFEARKDLDQAVKLYMMVALLYKDPKYSPQALLQAGIVLQSLNNNQEALNAYRQVLEEYPQSSVALKAREFVEKIK